MIVQRSFNKLQACKPEKRVNNENLLIKETHTYSAGIFDPSSTLMNQNDAIWISPDTNFNFTFSYAYLLLLFYLPFTDLQLKNRLKTTCVFFI